MISKKKKQEIRLEITLLLQKQDLLRIRKKKVAAQIDSLFSDLANTRRMIQKQSDDLQELVELLGEERYKLWVKERDSDG